LPGRTLLPRGLSHTDEMDLRAGLVVLTLIGFALTTGGLVDAARGARKALQHEKWRIRKFDVLEAAYDADVERLSSSGEDHDDFFARWDAEYKRYGLTRPTNANLTLVPLVEAERVVSVVLGSAFRGSLVAAAGLVLGTVASIWSLWQ
jgi:hypothetical protein